MLQMYESSAQLLPPIRKSEIFSADRIISAFFSNFLKNETSLFEKKEAARIGVFEPFFVSRFGARLAAFENDFIRPFRSPHAASRASGDFSRRILYFRRLLSAIIYKRNFNPVLIARCFFASNFQIFKFWDKIELDIFI